MDDRAHSNRTESLILAVVAIISVPAVIVWWMLIWQMQPPFGGFWVLYGLLALGAIASLALMPLAILNRRR